MTDYIRDFYDFDSASESLNADFKEHIAPTVYATYPNDQIAMNEAFNNWTDSLCKEGTIPEHLYNDVCCDDYTDSEWLEIADSV